MQQGNAVSFELADRRLADMLAEDAPYGDATTLGLGIGHRHGEAVFRARGAQTVACVEEAARLMRLAGCTLIEPRAASGDAVAAGDVLLRVQGPAAALHCGSKVAQTLLEIASGVATRARRILDAARQGRPGIMVACTRKHLPGAKDVMLRAIMAGGCIPHRLGLSDSVLVFAQHRAFLGEADPAIWIARLRAAQPERKIAVEADDVAEALRFAAAGAHTLQLDKVSPADVAAVVAGVRARGLDTVVAATGGVHEGNAAAFAEAGADLLVTSAPYAAPPADIGVAMAAVAS